MFTALTARTCLHATNSTNKLKWLKWKDKLCCVSCESGERKCVRSGSPRFENHCARDCTARARQWENFDMFCFGVNLMHICPRLVAHYFLPLEKCYNNFPELPFDNATLIKLLIANWWVVTVVSDIKITFEYFRTLEVSINLMKL
jgi:hypothetical protein